MAGVKYRSFKDCYLFMLSKITWKPSWTQEQVNMCNWIMIPEQKLDS